MKTLKGLFCSVVVAVLLLPSISWAEEFQINAEARVFNPDILYVKPGDTISFVNMASHDSVSVDGFIPEGAQPWKSGIGNNLSIKLDVEGTYLYVCVPHLGFGMVGIIVVGEAKDIDDVMTRAQAKLEGPYRRLIGKILKVQQAAKAK